MSNFPSKKPQCLLVSPLYSSSHLEWLIIAVVNVDIFHHPLENAEVEAARKIENILAQARTAGVNIDLRIAS